MLFHTRRVTRLGRPEEVVDSINVEQVGILCDQKKLHHGRVFWLRCEDKKYYWDGYEKKFVPEDVFTANRTARAQANLRKHGLAPFGKLARKKRALEEGVPPPYSLGWARA